VRIPQLLIVGAILAGCGGCGRPAAPGPATPVRGYGFEVRAADGSTATGQAATFSVQSGEHLVVMKNGSLSISGQPYGHVEDGANVFVDENGRVFVNGIERSPEQ
jgi:hypothetical protein